MPPVLEQSAYNAAAKYQTRSVKVTFSKKTKPGSLIVVVCLCAGALPVGLTGPSGFTKIGETGLRDLEMAVWYKQNAESISQVTVGYEPLTMRSIQARAFEYSGMAQNNVVDKVSIWRGENTSPYTGITSLPSQDDSLALAFCANQYGSTTQFSFRGNLARLFESVSPLSWIFGSNQDWERSRLTVHQAISVVKTAFNIALNLATTRRWICILVVFKGGSLGPVKLTSLDSDNPPIFTTGQPRADLTCFGPLESNNEDTLPQRTITSGSTVAARIGPSNYQYRLGGWSGLLIGSGTEFHVEGTEGLGGMEVRTSDDDLPRGDGALRGIDLESARTMMFQLNIGKGRQDVELNMDTLMRALRPQRDEDWELIWRHPTQPLKMMRVRPVNIMRNRDKTQLIYAKQAFTLRAADPRHYGAIPKEVRIPVSTDENNPITTPVVNIGNLPAFPIITIKKPTGSTPVNRIRLVNATALVTFDVQLVLQRGSTLVGDMEAYNTGAARSIITLDGQSKYGSWQLPREPFRIEPDPTGFGAFNQVYLITDPPGQAIECTLQYRDTWSG